MTVKNVRCVDCKFCDREKSWCTIKALVVTKLSRRSCKVYVRREGVAEDGTDESA